MADTLRDAFLDELKDAYDAEKQLTKALPKMAKAATSPELREAFEMHLDETRGQIDRLEQIFELLDEKAKGKHCDGIEGILTEGSAVMEEDFEDSTMDACLIASGQRAEHYEMAAYGTLVSWAQVLGRPDVARLLEQTLNEEKAADTKLTNLAERGINKAAADAARGERGRRRGSGRSQVGCQSRFQEEITITSNNADGGPIRRPSLSIDTRTFLQARFASTVASDGTVVNDESPQAGTAGDRRNGQCARGCARLSLRRRRRLSTRHVNR